MNQWITIPQAGVEGGGITLYGQYNGKGWIFRKDISDQTPLLIDEPARHSASDQMYAWAEALDALDVHPWHRFCPLQVHPAFRGAVLGCGIKTNQAWHDCRGLRVFTVAACLQRTAAR